VHGQGFLCVLERAEVEGHHDGFAATQDGLAKALGEARQTPGAVAEATRIRPPTPNAGNAVNAVKSASSMGSAPPLDSFNRPSSSKAHDYKLALTSAFVVKKY
jgi:hypothetical protein